ncbi:MAG: hypothetical protein DHS20C14_21690 [Phycisphaeraceae bacterium]|nr:MAG: hypothetical protein DHS20C14_21690 [Phycisphaeraceae bacterium]
MLRMKLTSVCAAALAACCGTAIADAPMDTPAGLAGPDALFQKTIAREMMRLLPVEAQMDIRAAEGVGSETEPLSGAGVLVLGDRYEKIAQWVSPESYAVIEDGHLNMLAAIADSYAQGNPVPGLCFEPGTSVETVLAFDLAYKTQQLRYQATNPWTSTATDGAIGGGNGTPITLTYSYVPDGTTVVDLGIGLGSGPSALFAWMNGIYGSPATWQPLFDGVFDRWSQVCNVTYVYEPNDDGANTNGPSGSLGVRGDVRIAAFNFANDGNGGVLAYNNFPNDGDMVFDAFDTFYNNTGGSSLRLRNVAAHEHGHGLGMLHVCPANQTKLMEPFISTAYDGPQLDDILHGQRKYGDLLEPNDNAGEASPLGNVSIGTIAGTSGTVSIDDNSDTDYYEINVLQAVRLTVDATLAAASYVQGTQTQACNTGTLTDYNAMHDLQILLYSSDGTTLVDSSNSTGEGSDEQLVSDIASAGTYYIRILGDTTNDIQAYNLLLNATTPPFIGPSILATLIPTEMMPGVAYDVQANINPNQDTLVGTPDLFYRYDGGAFLSTAMTNIGGNNWEGTLPGASCGDTPEFYIEAVGSTAGSVFDPPAGAAGPYTATVGTTVVVFDDNFEADMGWTVNNSAGLTDGAWVRTTPTQGGDARVADPPSDADGSGQCFITDNGADNSDVDGGSTTLLSPVFDVSGDPEATVSYYRWYDNNEDGSAGNPFTETFEIEISDNGGGSWTSLETVGPAGGEVSGGWFYKTFLIADFVGTTANVRVRFIASDDVATVVEAGVDGFSISSTECEDADPCICDCDGNGVLNVDDVDCFVAAFVGGDLALGDCDGNGSLNVDDVDCFVACFIAGCP